MRLGISWSFAVVCVLGSFACKSTDEPPVYLDADYQVRCLDCQPRTADEPEREVALLNGEFDTTVTCAISRVGGERSMTLTMGYKTSSTEQRYGFRITRGDIDSEEQTDECEVQILEGANTYKGTCSGDDPTENVPCKVTFKPDGEIVNGTMYCEKMTLVGAPTNFRYLVDPGTTDKSAKFAVHNCSNL
jgi:hypothetical protein